MRHNRLLILPLLAALWAAFAFNPSNPPLSRTGAPGEETCGIAGCHSGGTFTGSIALTGIPDTVTPDRSYTATLTFTSNAVVAGFEMTALDGANAKSGTLIVGSGTNVATNNQNARQYVRQSIKKTLSGGATSWSFTWKAPSTASGNKTTFYYVALGANDNDNKTGDKHFTGSKPVTLKTTVNTSEELAGKIKLFPTLASSVLTLELGDLDGVQAQLFDAQGKLVRQQALQGRTPQIDISALATGQYFLHLQHEGRTAVKRFQKV